MPHSHTDMQADIQADIARVHRPIGLDIGSRSPAEIAVSTVAGLLAGRAGRSGGVYTA